MKLKSCSLLFCIFSFLSDKTNGAPFFVKYKLLLGALIISIGGETSVLAQKEASITKPSNPHISGNQGNKTSQKSHIASKGQDDTVYIEVKGFVKDKGRGPLQDVLIHVKNSSLGSTTNKDGYFSVKVKKNDKLIFSCAGFAKKEVPVSQMRGKNTNITLQEDGTILCYEVIIVRIPYGDDIYASSYKKRKGTTMSYAEVDIYPVSPVGDIDAFQDWVQNNIQNNGQLIKEKGEVLLSFSIDKQGKIKDKKVIQKLSEEADKEALRVLSLSEKWKPGIYNDKPAKTTVIISVTFNCE